MRLAAAMGATSSLIGFALPRHGTFTLAEAQQHGVSRRVMARLLRDGEVLRCHPGVYRFAVVPVTPAQRIWAAVRAAESRRRRAFASHSSAGLLLGLPGVAAGRPEITVASTSLPVLHGVRVHRSTAVGDAEVTIVAGIPTSVGSRAVCECAAGMDERRRIELVDAAICQGVTTRAQLCTRALASPRMPGRATILRVTEPGADGTFRSALERVFGRQVRRSGLPQPRYNVVFRVRGQVRVVDALFDPNVSVDLQGLRFHSSPRQVQRDAQRLNLSTQLGLRTQHFTWDQVLYDFDAVAATIRAAIALAG